MAIARLACTVEILNCCNQAITLIDPGQPSTGGFECNGDLSPTTCAYVGLHDPSQ
jgi:hypothetical protein